MVCLLLDNDSSGSSVVANLCNGGDNVMQWLSQWHCNISADHHANSSLVFTHYKAIIMHTHTHTHRQKHECFVLLFFEWNFVPHQMLTCVCVDDQCNQKRESYKRGGDKEGNRQEWNENAHMGIATTTTAIIWTIPIHFLVLGVL